MYEFLENSLAELQSFFESTKGDRKEHQKEILELHTSVALLSFQVDTKIDEAQQKYGSAL